MDDGGQHIVVIHLAVVADIRGGDEDGGLWVGEIR